MQMTHPGDSRASTAVVAAIVVDLAFAAYVALARSSASSPGAAVESTLLPAGFLLTATFAAPSFFAALGIRDRPVLAAVAACLALALAVVPLSVLSFVLLVPGALLLYAAARIERPEGGRGTSDERGHPWRLWILAALLLALVVLALLGGFLTLFALLWAAGLLGFLAACVIVLRTAASGATRAAAFRAAAGGFAAVGLCLVAPYLPLLGTTTVCWQRTAGQTRVVSAERATQLGRPEGSASWGAGSVGPEGASDAAGCDSGVPTPAALVGSAVALLAVGVIAVVAAR